KPRRTQTSHTLTYKIAAAAGGCQSICRKSRAHLTRELYDGTGGAADGRLLRLSAPRKLRKCALENADSHRIRFPSCNPPALPEVAPSLQPTAVPSCARPPSGTRSARGDRWNGPGVDQARAAREVSGLPE